MPNRTHQNKLTIEIPAPKFDHYEFLTLYWNEQERTVKVVGRWFDLTEHLWWYKIQESEVLDLRKCFLYIEAVF